MGERRGMKALEVWCRRVTQGYPGVKIENMTTSWRDGLAFCAIIHHFRPDLIDFSRLDKSDIYGNNELAFRIAERHLGIPALLDAEDMLEYPVPDKLSIMTYLSQFYQAFASNASSPIKRTSSSPESPQFLPTAVPASQSKEVPAVGRSHEPCALCSLPVFIAQRLRVGGKLYHRTCFKCASCKTQLNPVEFYQTPSGEHLCEGCLEPTMASPRPPSPPPTLILDYKTEPHPGEPPPTIPATSPAPPALPDSPPPTSPSIVGARKLMFESYALDTDDAKLGSVPSTDLAQRADTLPNRDPTHVPIPSIPSPSPTPIPNAISDVGLSSSSVVAHSSVQVNEALNTALLQTDSDVEFHGDNSEISLVESKNPDVLSERTTEVDSIKCDVVKDPIPQPAPKDPVSDYPEELNPFSSDDEEEVSTPSKSRQGQSNPSATSTNPFGSDTEEEEEPPKHHRSKVSLNPFGSDSEDESIPVMDTPPVPRPRRYHKTPEVSPAPSPMPRTKLRSSTRSIGSLSSMNSVSSRKKRPAPPPPTLQATSPPNPNNDLKPSKPSTKTLTLRSRKIRRAPLPPNFGLSQSTLSMDSTCSDVSMQSVESEMSTQGESHLPPPPPPPLSQDPELNRTIEAIKNITLEVQTLTETANELNIYSMDSNRTTEVDIDCKNESAEVDKTEPEEPTDSSLEKAQMNDDNIEFPEQVPSSTPVKNMSIESQKLDIDSEETVAEKENKGTASLTVSPAKKLVAVDWDKVKSDLSESPPESLTLQSPSKEKPALPKKPSFIKPLPTSPPCKTQITSLVPVPTYENHSPSEDKIVETKPKKPTTLDLKHVITVEGTTVDVSQELESQADFDKLDRPSSPSISNQGSIHEDESNFISPPTEKKHKDSANLQKQNLDTMSIGSGRSLTRWKRKKAAPAPPLPQSPPMKRNVKPMPIDSLKQELHDIEIKQLGLERQGVALEKKIREQFGSEGSVTAYVEELIVQLFELVNEKNELFRRQAELMYLRRQHQLEEEHADLEYQIRCLMAQPESNKTDCDKAREEELIKRLVEVVERRDAIVQCLERDRIRETEEDKSVLTQLDIFCQAMESDDKGTLKNSTKKKVKKDKDKFKVLDLDKDLDESEKETKRKKWFSRYKSKR